MRKRKTAGENEKKSDSFCGNNIAAVAGVCIFHGTYLLILFISLNTCVFYKNLLFFLSKNGLTQCLKTSFRIYPCKFSLHG